MHLNKKILLIADGIWGDEPLQADRFIRKVKAEIEAGNLLAIFSSREYGIANINSPFSTSDTYTIAPLSALQQDELVKKCVDHYNGLVRETKRTAVFLSAKLRSLHDVDRMKENPMLLTILIGQYLQGNELPHNNIAAMDCIMEQLFVKHQQSRKCQAYDYSGSFDYTSNKMMLGVLSKEMFDNYNDGSMDKTQAEILLNQYLNSQTSGHELSNAHIVDDLFRHDTHQLGVIEERRDSRISFINRQLQDFMAAKYLSVDIDRAKVFIRDNVSNTGLHQVVLFLFEMMPASAFVGLYNILKPIKVNNYRDYYLDKLKLEILVRSVKAPKHFLLEEIEKYIHRIEWESDYDTKHDLLEILLDGLYNTSLQDRIEDFISRYIPSAPIYHDCRLSSLAQVAELTEEDRQFIVLTVINGDVNNKILASEVIRNHIAGDAKLLEMINSYIAPSTLPEVVAFFIRSVIVDGIDIDKENELVRKVVAGDIFTHFYQIEFSLFKGEPASLDEFLELVAELPFSIQEEANRLLQQYFPHDGTVMQKALVSVSASYRERGSISKDIAWKYLLTCWINHPNVVEAIKEELNNNKISQLSSMNEHLENMLRLFKQEGNAYVLCDTVLCLVDHLKRTGRDTDVFKVAEEVFDTTQLTTEYAYKMRFCIYLMYHKLDEYVQLILRTGGKEYEFVQMDIFYNNSPYIEKTIVDEVDYLLADDMANLKKTVKEDKELYSYIVFFSKYINPTSDAARIIVKYLNENRDNIDDANILLFLNESGKPETVIEEIGYSQYR